MAEFSEKSLRLAICGIRGIPACYGGFETFAEELAPRLVAQNIEVIVYGRRHVIEYTDSYYKGAEIRLLSAPQHKYLETPVHTLWSFLDIVRRRDVDVVLLCNAANSPFIPILRLFGIPVMVNVDGIERKRAKWNWLGRSWYRLGEISSVLFANSIVADADVISDYYRTTYRAKSEVIRYGFSQQRLELSAKRLEFQSPFVQRPSVFEQFRLNEGKYLLYVARIEPENNAHCVIEAYSKLNQCIQKQYPLVIVGDAPYSDAYKERLRILAQASNVVFTGYQFGQAYEHLQLGAYFYVQASEVGGTHPALVEALGFANAVIANDTPEHREVVGDAGLYYQKNSCADLTRVMEQLIESKSMRERLQNAAWKLIAKEYSWDKIANSYNVLAAKLSRRTR